MNEKEDILKRIAIKYHFESWDDMMNFCNNDIVTERTKEAMDNFHANIERKKGVNTPIRERNYNGFAKHIRRLNDSGHLFTYEELIALTKIYNTNIPKLVGSSLVFGLVGYANLKNEE